VASGCPLAAVLDALMHEVQALLPGASLAVAVTEDDGSVERHGSELRQDALSLPIRSSMGRALGTLYIDHPAEGAQPPHQQPVIEMALQLTALAIEAERASRALMQSEARIWAFMEYSFALISIKDRQGRYVIVNRRFEQSTGVPAAVARGRTDAQLFPRALAEAYSAHDEEVLRSLKGIEFEEQIRQRDGMRTYLAAKFPLLHPGGEAYGTGAILLDMTERKQSAHALESAREEERTRISRELHDELGQLLTALGMSQSLLAANVRKRLPEAAWVAAEVESLNKAVVDMLDAVRRIATRLRPDVLERLGLAGAVRWQVEEFSRRSGIRCRVALPEAAIGLAAGASLAVFRILQEALSNVARHSGATEVAVALARDGSHLELAVDDNGRGMQDGAGGSLGLLGMRERAAAARGSLEVRRSPWGGTRITLRVPVE
jgi:PAS domain S-box-containing protein